MQTATFDGADYDHKRDSARLTSQIETIFNLMRDGKFRSVAEIGRLTGYPENSIQAQLRNLRKARFGSHTLNRKHIKNGFNLYQIVENTNPQKRLF